MSLVGPRPHAVAHNEEYRKLIKRYMVRHKVLPGITGLAQVRGCRGETARVEDMEARVVFDLEYMRNWSPMLDLQIILATVVRRDPDGSGVLMTAIVGRRGLVWRHCSESQRSSCWRPKCCAGISRSPPGCRPRTWSSICVAVIPRAAHGGRRAARSWPRARCRRRSSCRSRYAIVTLAGRRHWSSSIQGYDFIASGIKLKSGLIDYYIFFLVFLFGVQHRRRWHEGHQVDCCWARCFANVVHDSRHRRHHQPRLPERDRRPHRRAPSANPTSTPRTSSCSCPATDRGRRGASRLQAAVLARRRAGRRCIDAGR